MYYTGAETSNNYATVWRLTLSTGDSTWVIIGTVLPLACFLKISSNRFFIAGMDSNPVSNQKLVFAVLEWGNPSLVWKNFREINSNKNTSRIQYAEAVLSDNGQKLYSIVGQET